MGSNARCSLPLGIVQLFLICKNAGNIKTCIQLQIYSITQQAMDGCALLTLLSVRFCLTKLLSKKTRNIRTQRPPLTADFTHLRWSGVSAYNISLVFLLNQSRLYHLRFFCHWKFVPRSPYFIFNKNND